MKFWEPFKTIYKNRVILWETSWNDIYAKYAGSVMGILWAALYPLILLAIYSFVYIFVFKSTIAGLSQGEYVLMIFSGLIPFLGFSEGLSLCIPAVTSNSALIKNTLFPIELLPVKAILVSQTSEIVGICVLFFALVINQKITPYILLLPIVWVLQMLLSIGLAWILSAINVFFRDLQNIIPLLTIMLMMLSPIAYTSDMIPKGMLMFQRFNIMYYLITCYQDILSTGKFPGWRLLVLAFIACVFYGVGYWLFMQLKQVFSDYA